MITSCCIFFVEPIIGTLSITSSPSDIVLDGSAVTLSCSGTLSSAIDDPSLLEIITWHHRGMIVQTISNISLSNNGTAFTNTLTIDPFTISSVGGYSCRVRIHFSEIEIYTTIEARRKPFWLYLVLTLFT